MDPQGKPQINKVDIEAMCDEIEEPWSPMDLVTVNDQVVRMALCHGEYHWHRHKNEDELFYAYRGSLVIQVKGHSDITLRQGEMTVIPKGVEHCPKSVEPSYVLLFEPFDLLTRGN